VLINMLEGWQALLTVSLQFTWVIKIRMWVVLGPHFSFRPCLGGSLGPAQDGLGKARMEVH